MKTVTSVLLILAALTAGPLLARDTGRFERFDFKLKGQITDIVIHYEDQSEHVSEFHVFINRGPWISAK